LQEKYSYYKVVIIAKPLRRGAASRIVRDRMQQTLGEFEQLVMFAVLRLDDEAYGAAIRRELLERAGRDVSPGAIFTTLERLEAMGLVGSSYGEPTQERGGRRKRFYRVRAEGRRALAASLDTVLRMARGLELSRKRS
jgi:PadR family transcriptional regulator, regulatory protein PadR